MSQLLRERRKTHPGVFWIIAICWLRTRNRLTVGHASRSFARHLIRMSRKAARAFLGIEWMGRASSYADLSGEGVSGLVRGRRGHGVGREIPIPAGIVVDSRSL